MSLSLDAVDEVNRATLFFCEKEIVSKTGAVKDSWFAEREEPADTWKPDSVPQIKPVGSGSRDEILDQFNSAKKFHDQWRKKIFKDIPDVFDPRGNSEPTR